jgi:hypothetical protein
VRGAENMKTEDVVEFGTVADDNSVDAYDIVLDVLMMTC